jgi:hypothetical protein
VVGVWVDVAAAHPNASLAYARRGTFGHPERLQGERNEEAPLIAMLLAATVALAMLATPGGAAKPVYSVTCVVGTGGLTTVTWISGTSSAHVIWRDASSTPVGEALVTVTTHGPDSTVLDTPATNPASANVSFSGKKPAFALGVCTSA